MGSARLKTYTMRDNNASVALAVGESMGVRLDENQMTMRHPRGVAVRQGAWLLFRKVQEQRPAEGDVELLHSEADAENRQLAFNDLPDE